MNAYFEKKETFDSNKRIIEAYFGEAVNTVGAGQKLLDSIVSWLAVILRVLTCTVARRIAKATAVAVTLVAFIGVIGAMETGALSLGLGLAVGAILLVIEYLCLRPQRS